LLVAILAATPLGLALAQDEHDHDHDQQQQTSPQHPQEQHPAQQHPNAAPQGQQHPAQGATPQSQHPAQGGTPQFQRPAQNATPQNASPQVQQRAPQQHNAPASVQAAPQQQSAPRANFQAGGARTPQAGAANASFAGRHYGAAPAQFVGGHFYGRDYAHFTPDDRARWYRGTWHHEFLDGRYGWWYEVDGIWYFFDAPIYPFPTFIPDVVYLPDEDDFAPPPPLAVMAPQAPSGNFYYYCPDSQTYYPYVSSCPSPWQPVPVAPPQ
jgi:hypothetical protein